MSRVTDQTLKAFLDEIKAVNQTFLDTLTTTLADAPAGDYQRVVRKLGEILRSHSTNISIKFNEAYSTYPSKTSTHTDTEFKTLKKTLRVQREISQGYQKEAETNAASALHAKLHDSTTEITRLKGLLQTERETHKAQLLRQNTDITRLTKALAGAYKTSSFPELQTLRAEISDLKQHIAVLTKQLKEAKAKTKPTLTATSRSSTCSSTSNGLLTSPIQPAARAKTPSPLLLNADEWPKLGEAHRFSPSTPLTLFAPHKRVWLTPSAKSPATTRPTFVSRSQSC